ncbi:PQ loop repeat-domain-containing protein [Glomus cerebriforme]|uniref:PQ loop repeat-domain-containing protein n=1 Tax=Glomus cerebriforme TaxID=658196 RepID=A0A397TWD4_9GLOM|nr:PQ loop repeat-domain-containing protein [Glomus cerebriforme]
MENLIEVLEECNIDENKPIDVFIAVFLAFGILISYLPQHYKIISTKSSEGISPLFLLLGAVSMTCSYFNILILQFVQFGCCINTYSAGYCFENVLGIIQLTIQWACFTMILILFISYFPEYEKTIPNISLGSGYNSLTATIYSPEWLYSLQVAGAVGVHFIFTLIVSAYLLIFIGGAENKTTRYWADLLGVISLILASVQYLPQIWKTWRRKSVGALSIQMMLLQTPGSFLFAYSLASSKGTRWSTWIVFLITGCLQGTLLVMCICWHYREKREKLLDENLIIGPDGNLVPDEHTRLLGSQTDGRS